MGSDQDDTVVMPLRTVQRRLTGTQDIARLTISVRKDASLDTAKERLVLLLRERRKISENEDDNFRIMDTRQIAETLTGTTQILTMLLGAVAAVSLLVGGIGIMNIMLVSVTERTREIGIRMAIGARPNDIRLQFLLEAVIISVAGCLIGVLLGVAGAFAVASTGKLLVLVTLSSMILAFTVAAAIGIFFGFYPANKAAKLKPIEALRYQ